MALIDTHCHLWKKELSGKGWLSADMGFLYRTFDTDDLAHAGREVGVDACVVIEAGKTPEENTQLQRFAESSPSIEAFLSYADLDSPDLAKDLDIWQSDPKFRGVRMGLEGSDSSDILARPNVINGLREIARRDLIFEFLVQTPQLRDVVAVYDKIPELKGIIEHMGKPDLIDREDFAQWKEHVSVLARNSHVTCKLSFSPRIQHFKALLANPEGALSSDLIEPYSAYLLEHFGPERLMWGSDWPICLLFGDYAEIRGVFDEAVSGLKEQDRTRIFGGNAVAFYGLDLQGHGGL